MIDVSVVIVSWNAKAYVEECLASLHSSSGSLKVEIIVVDNDSSDGTPELIRNRFPEVRLIEAGGNLGFAKANNLGIARASGKYLCLVNPDVDVPEDCLVKMYGYMEGQPAVGLLGPKMLGADGKVHRSTMRFPTLWDCAIRSVALDRLFKSHRSFGGYLMFDFDFDEVRDVDVLNGWFWMVRREALDQVGLLDERFFLYGEDIDWCKRFHEAGWRVVFYPGAKALHYGGGSSANAPVRCYVEMQRANLQYWKKYHGHASTALYLATMGLNHLVRATAYSLMYCVESSTKAKASLHIRRNLASLRWLMGFK